MIFTPVTSTSLEVAVGATSVGFASTMLPGVYWRLVANVGLWLKQANPSGTITCDTNANMADGDTVTINDGINSAVVYEYDKASNGVTAGHIVWAAGTTALSVATNLAAAIAANQPYITVVNNGDGSLTLSSTSRNITLTKSSASALAVTSGPVASAGAGSMFLPANTPLLLKGDFGSDVAVIEDSSGGKASLTRMIQF